MEDDQEEGADRKKDGDLEKDVGAEVVNDEGFLDAEEHEMGVEVSFEFVAAILMEVAVEV